MKNPIVDEKKSERMVRGGSWFDYPLGESVSYRYDFEPTYRLSRIGFRIVRNQK